MGLSTLYWIIGTCWDYAGYVLIILHNEDVKVDRTIAISNFVMNNWAHMGLNNFMGLSVDNYHKIKSYIYAIMKNIYAAWFNININIIISYIVILYTCFKEYAHNVLINIISQYFY